MKAKDLVTKTEAELVELLDAQQLEQFRLRMAKATGQLTQAHNIQVVRKTIARVKTILTQKQGGV